MKKVLVLGGDGYIGWPTAMYLSNQGYEVVVVDNYLRRNLMHDLGVKPLFSSFDLEQRVKIWNELSSNTIRTFIGDLNEWDFVHNIFSNFLPDVVIHFAEQPSAPYSMLDRKSASLTLRNNILVTANLIFAVNEFNPDAHIIKLGTMGEYGTPNIDIEEGWIDIHHKGRSDKFLFPRQASSLYHTTKIMDTDLLWFYVRNWNLKVTDLMQGPVYGLFTHETLIDDRLLPFFSYDEIFGTVINRFIIQAVVGHPLTVYGKGGQTRGYINIHDAIKCIELTIKTPAESGSLRIYNQFTEKFTVNTLANMIRDAAVEFGLDVNINNITNPRSEQEDHYYNPVHTGLSELGLQPTTFDSSVIQSLIAKVLHHKSDINIEAILKNITWA